MPDDQLEAIALSPGLYEPASRTFEMQRTPNMYPTGRLTFGAAGAVALGAASQFGAAGGGGPFDVTPIAARAWKLLGGIIAPSVACTVLIRADGGKRAFWAWTFGAVPVGGISGIQPFSLPGNGARVITTPTKSFEIWCSAAGTVDFVFYVAEEPEVT